MNLQPQKPLLSKHINFSSQLKIIDRNRFYSNFGPLYNKLKKKIEHKLKIKKCSVILTSSGHTALQACCNLIAHHNKKKIVIVPSFSFASNPQTIISSGLKPFFVDIKKDTLEMDYDDASQVILKNKKNIAAIMICSPFGYPIDIKTTHNFFSKFKIPIIYDLADAIMNISHIDEKKINSFFTFSFHPTKNIAANESGMIVATKTNADKLKSIINFGFYGKHREIFFKGFNGKFSEYDSAILNANLNDFKSKKKKITKISKYIVSRIKNKSIIFQKNYGIKWFGLKMILRHKIKNFKTISKILNQKGIQIYKPWTERPMHEYKIFRSYKKTKLKNTKEITSKIFAVPIYVDMKKKHLDFIINQLNQL